MTREREPEQDAGKKAAGREKAGRYSRTRTGLFLADLVLSTLLLVVFMSVFSRPAADLAYRLSGNYYISRLVYGLIFLGYLYLLSLPLSFYSSYIVEHRYGLSTQTVRDWSLDRLKSGVLSTALSLICIGGFYFFLRNFPDLWWLIAGAAWILFSVVLARLLPVVIIPLFYKYMPVDDEELKKRILGMAREADLRVIDVYRIDLSSRTRKANAALAGLGSTRRVVLSDTLTDDFDRDEILNVVAHEFGHSKFAHIWKLLLFSALVTICGFFLLDLAAEAIVRVSGASSLTDVYLLPVLVLLFSLFGL
ncbi:MAG: M48 family metalloprotease, partial [Candidatus Omnitrophica bacterium]|nr:M48 family metalloprotease [Candidatus Omnitrophota bacterium]